MNQPPHGPATRTSGKEPRRTQQKQDKARKTFSHYFAINQFIKSNRVHCYCCKECVICLNSIYMCGLCSLNAAFHSWSCLSYLYKGLVHLKIWRIVLSLLDKISKVTDWIEYSADMAKRNLLAGWPWSHTFGCRTQTVCRLKKSLSSMVS
jgi:hypothetical protein